MRTFRAGLVGLGLVATVLLTAVAPAAAGNPPTIDGPALGFSATVSTAPTLRADGITELSGQMVLQCTDQPSTFVCPSGVSLSGSLAFDSVNCSALPSSTWKGVVNLAWTVGSTTETSVVNALTIKFDKAFDPSGALGSTLDGRISTGFLTGARLEGTLPWLPLGCGSLGTTFTGLDGATDHTLTFVRGWMGH